MQEGCSERSPYFQIPPYITGEYGQDVERQFWETARLPLKLPSVWEGTNQSMLAMNNSGINSLQTIQDMPIQSLQDILHEEITNRNIKYLHVREQTVYKKLFIGIMSVILIIAVAVISITVVYTRVYSRSGFMTIKQLDTMNECVSERGNCFAPTDWCEVSCYDLGDGQP